MEDLDEPGMATNIQKQKIKDLVYCHIEDSETRELYLNQLNIISEVEAKIVINSFSEGMW